MWLSKLVYTGGELEAKAEEGIPQANTNLRTASDCEKNIFKKFAKRY